MICKKCGSNQSDNAKFCSNCGNKIEVDNDEKVEETDFEQNSDNEIEGEQAFQQKDSNATEEPINNQQTYQYVQPQKNPLLLIKSKKRYYHFGVD